VTDERLSGLASLRPGRQAPGTRVPELAAEIARLAGTNPEPIGRPGGPGIWGTGKELPTLFQHVRNELMAKGTPEGKAHQLAYGIIRNWSEGHDGHGNKVSAETQAEAVKAMAQINRLRAEAKATRSEHPMSSSIIDPTWDGSLDDVPDLAGLTLADLDSAAEGDGDHAAWAAADDASRADTPPAGQGGRFAALAAKLRAKGAADPEALAAKIGRAKYGKGKFNALAAKARAKAPGKVAPGGQTPAVRGSWGELFRYWPLEECKILSRADGHASGRVVEAYAAVYGQPAEIRDHQGHYEEDIDRGAFDDTLRVIHPSLNGGFWRATCLYNHGMTVHGTPAERFSLPAGVPVHISSEGKGLLTRTEYAATPLGDELLELVAMGALRSQSFTGGIIRSNPSLRGPGDRYRRVPGGALQRVTRLALGLREYGLTPFAAYSGAEVLGVRMQLPGGLTSEPDWDERDAEVPAGHDGGDPGGSPADEPASRSTGNRLYRLRTRELLEQRGITLPDRD